MQFEVEESYHGRVMVLSLSGIFNLEAVATRSFQRPAEMVVSINERAKNGEEGVEPYGLIIELKDLERMDSAGLGTLLGVAKKMSELGKEIRLCSVSQKVWEFLWINKSSLTPLMDDNFYDSLRHFQGYY